MDNLAKNILNINKEIGAAKSCFVRNIMLAYSVFGKITVLPVFSRL